MFTELLRPRSIGRPKDAVTLENKIDGDIRLLADASLHAEDQLAEALKNNKLLHFNFERSWGQMSRSEFADRKAELEQSDASLAEKTKIARDIATRLDVLRADECKRIEREVAKNELKACVEEFNRTNEMQIHDKHQLNLLSEKIAGTGHRLSLLQFQMHEKRQHCQRLGVEL